MNRIILLLLFISCTADTQIDWVYSLPKPWTLSNEEVTELLPEFHERFPEFSDRLKAINIWRIGTPYGIFKLGEEIEPDLDPILRIDTSDCTVHVLTFNAEAVFVHRYSSIWFQVQHARSNLQNMKPFASNHSPHLRGFNANLTLH